MVLHMIALAKFHCQLTSHALRPAAAGILCPLVLKFLMGFRLCRDGALHRSRLFLFRLGHIAFNRDTPISTVSRMERALRLIWGTVGVATTASRASPPSSEEMAMGEETLHSFSMIAL